MPVTFGANIASLQIRTQLDRATKATASSFERLSSGLRINKAGDDIAGLLLATTLHTEGLVHAQAVRNINDGLSYLSAAETGIASLQGILKRMSELAGQAANGTYTDVQRTALDSEFQALKEEYGRIVTTTKFNERAILTDEELVNGITIQAGFGSGDALRASFSPVPGGGTAFVGDGTFQAQTLFERNPVAGVLSADSADFNNDGKLDLVSGLDVFIGNGDGTFLSAQSYTYDGVEPADVITGDFNGDGKIDFISSLRTQGKVGIHLGNGDGTFIAAGTYNSGTAYDLDVGDFDGDGKIDIVTSDYSSSSIRILIGNGDGSFNARTAYTAAGTTASVAVGDFNNDSKLDVISRSSVGGQYSVFLHLGNGNGSFSAYTTTAMTTGLQLRIADLDGDGNLDYIASPDSSYVHVVLGNGNGTFKMPTTYRTTPASTYGFDLADVNGDGKTDLISYGKQSGFIGVLLGNGNGTFDAAASYDNNFMWGIAGTIGDFNNDGVLDIIAANSAGGTAISVFLGNGTESAPFADLSIATVGGAGSALTSLETYRGQLDSLAGEVGAFTSRLNVAVSLAATRAENARAAEGRITNLDVAEEVAKLVRAQILSQAATALLAQANQQPGIALKLLQNVQV